MKSKELFPPAFSRHALTYQSRLEDIMSRGESAWKDAGPGGNRRASGHADPRSRLRAGHAEPSIGGIRGAGRTGDRSRPRAWNDRARASHAPPIDAL